MIVCYNSKLTSELYCSIFNIVSEPKFYLEVCCSLVFIGILPLLLRHLQDHCHHGFAVYTSPIKTMTTCFQRSQATLSNLAKIIIIELSTWLHAPFEFPANLHAPHAFSVLPSLSWCVSKSPITSLSIPLEKSCLNLSNVGDFTSIEAPTRLHALLEASTILSMRLMHNTCQILLLFHAQQALHRASCLSLCHVSPSRHTT